MSDKGERRRSRFGTQQSLALGFPSFPLVYLSVCVRVFGIFTLRTCAKGPAPDSSVPASVPNPMSLLSNDPAAGNPAPDTASFFLYSFTMPPERERLARNDTSRRRIKNRQTKKKQNKQEISNRQRRKRIAAGSYCGSVPKEKEEERDRERREGHQ